MRAESLEAAFPETLHLGQLIDSLESPLLPECDDALGCFGTNARKEVELIGGGSVEVEYSRQRVPPRSFRSLSHG